jgi:hypothetical protein
MNESDSDAVYSQKQTNNFVRILSENWHKKAEISNAQDLFPGADKSVKKIGRKRSVMHEFYSWMAISLYVDRRAVSEQVHLRTNAVE